MKSNIGWKITEDTFLAIIENIKKRRDEYVQEANSEFEQGVVAGYNFVLDSINNEFLNRGIKLDILNEENCCKNKNILNK